MDKPSKLGYGFLLVGAAMPYLIEHTSGATVALTATLACAIAGVVLLLAGHLHRGPNDPPLPRSRKIATGMLGIIVIFGACLAGWRVYRKSDRHPVEKIGISSPPSKVQPLPQIAQSSSPTATEPATSKKKTETARKITATPAEGKVNDNDKPGNNAQPTAPQTISAPNGIAIGGGTVTNPTVINNAPPVRITATEQIQRETGNSDAPWMTVFTISTNALTQTGDLRLKCSGPVLKAGISRINPMELITGNNGPNPSDPDEAIYELGPEMLAPGKVVTIAVYSKEPVKVISGSIGQQEIVF